MTETWRDAELDEASRALRGSRTGRTWLRVIAGSMAVVAVAVFLVSRGRVVFRCRGDCYGEPVEGYGSMTYEPGHPWTTYSDSWQWSAQHALAQVALVASLVALGLAVTSRRNPAPAFLVTLMAWSGWLIWVLLSPPIA